MIPRGFAGWEKRAALTFSDTNGRNSAIHWMNTSTQWRTPRQLWLLRVADRNHKHLYDIRRITGSSSLRRFFQIAMLHSGSLPQWVRVWVLRRTPVSHAQADSQSRTLPGDLTRQTLKSRPK